jgi:hypothetical protein
VLWLVDVDAFGTFEQGMQVKNEQQIAQGPPDQLQQQQQDQFTAVLPCVQPAASGRITVILPDGQKPSDGQGWASSGQPCASDPHALEPVGVSPPPQAAATGWLPTAYGWMPYAVGAADPRPLFVALHEKIDAGNAAVRYGQWAHAIQLYKEGGALGLQLGPLLDTLTGGRSAPLTHEAWSLNGALARVTDVNDVPNARALAAAILTKYVQATAMAT